MDHHKLARGWRTGGSGVQAFDRQGKGKPCSGPGLSPNDQPVHEAGERACAGRPPSKGGLGCGGHPWR